MSRRFNYYAVKGVTASENSEVLMINTLDKIFQVQRDIIEKAGFKQEGEKWFVPQGTVIITQPKEDDSELVITITDLTNAKKYIENQKNALNNKHLLDLFSEIKADNPTAILSGSLALSLQGIILRTLPNDIDIELPYGIEFNCTEGMKYIGRASYYPEADGFYRAIYQYIENDIKIDVFEPSNSSIKKSKTVTCANIVCAHYLDILNYKIQHAFSKKGSIKHTMDLVYILLWNTDIEDIDNIHNFANNLLKNAPNLPKPSYTKPREISTPPINLDRPLIFFDLETTGVDRVKDRMIELATIKFFPDNRYEVISQRFNPTIPIPQAASEVHHITDDDVWDKPTFADKAREIYEYFCDCDFAGYNILDFDLPVIIEEFLRVGIEPPFKENTKYVDALKIFYQNEKRDLEAAYKFYCGKQVVDAHSAESDALTTIEVLRNQISKYGMSKSIVELHNICNNGNRVIDYERKFIRNEGGEIVYNFGKHKGTSVLNNKNYLLWMYGQDFSKYTKYIIRKILAGDLV